MYSHFNLYGCQPVIFVNLLNPATMNEAVAAADKDVVNHKIALPIEAINDETLVVKPAGGSGNAYVKDTDYAVYYEGEYCYIELLPDGAAYSAESLNVAYKKVTPASVNAAAVATGMEAIEQCMATLGIVRISFALLVSHRKALLLQLWQQRRQALTVCSGQKR